MELNAAFPMPSKEQLTSAFVGKTLQDVPLPSAILDLAKLKTNCGLMLAAVKELQVDFRAHIKTHKTTELSQMQVGRNTKDARLICSTMAELEHLMPLAADYQQKGAIVNVLYGVPPGASHIPRLARFLQSMGPGTLTLMVDDLTQLKTVEQVYNQSEQSTVKVFLKTDSGYHRAGLAPTSTRMQDLVNATISLESRGVLHLLGFYSHNSLSYGGNSPLDAMDNLRVEVDACTQAAIHNCPKDYISTRNTPLSISCGASPTALSLQNLLSNSPDTAATSSANALRSSLAKAKEANISFEIHAGVYPTLDMQQVSASSRELGAKPEDNIAFTILSEICSTYPDRTEYPEALINAGVIALAREPCKSYRGHGVISGWNMPDSYDPYTKESRVIVDRISQEHGLLQWEDRAKKEHLPVEYGQRVQIWPNHACITGSQFGWSLIIDSESGDANVVRDVWVRWRGW
ncbi:hypothetical protein OHC33_008695 [Knufia fluminis]|uniref:D-serine dehydratase n=1 Tax=Knufia fluminis TaxID=191047 RepID=A0AAN8IJI3_9EURO|nr:hypothetical protein OHC33_008695 [Knufia fluminis]